MDFVPRPKQQEVLEYKGGKMGVSAVPGSGKTATLSYLTAQLVASNLLDEEQEVLVVTLVNSAVDNFSKKVAQFLQAHGLLPRIGYRVRTLHGLAHDIIRERPDLVGLSDDFKIVDDRTADQMRRDAASAWVRGHPDEALEFLSLELNERSMQNVLRSPRLWPRLVNDIATDLIKRAKDRQLEPTRLRQLLDNETRPRPLLEMASTIYADYQRALNYDGAVDFDDLIRLALRSLEMNPDYADRLRQRWPFVLEDEAQDSSQLQEQILRLLVGEKGNWVRVGDPNQAIFETFTTASPRYLRDFLTEKGVISRELPNSGRSTDSVISLANYLIDWTQQDHPVDAVRDALAPPHIQPTPPGDPQTNPPDDPTKIYLFDRKFTTDVELQAVVESLARWLPQHKDETVAVLVPRNDRGFKVVDALKKSGLEYVELLQSTRSTRETAGALANILMYLADPGSAAKLSVVFQVWRREDRNDPDANTRLRGFVSVLRNCSRVEEFLWPSAGDDWLDIVELAELDTDAGENWLPARQLLEQFRDQVRRWQAATLLPIDQLVLTLAQDLFKKPTDLAVSHKMAVILGRAQRENRDWRLPHLAEELATVARNQRRFIGFSDDDLGFDPENHKGKVLVTTYHKAKGLEWDRVHLMSVNNYDFPSGLAHDEFFSEKWFVRDQLNLVAEALAQMDQITASQPLPYEEGNATQQARLEYAAERLRLLYVGITRAKKELIVTWNTGRPSAPQQQAVPFLALRTFWENQNREHTS